MTYPGQASGHGCIAGPPMAQLSSSPKRHCARPRAFSFWIREKSRHTETLGQPGLILGRGRASVHPVLKGFTQLPSSQSSSLLSPTGKWVAKPPPSSRSLFPPPGLRGSPDAYLVKTPSCPSEWGLAPSVTDSMLRRVDAEDLLCLTCCWCCCCCCCLLGILPSIKLYSSDERIRQHKPCLSLLESRLR